MSSSPSISTMPPRHVKKLADTLDDAFKSNNKSMEDGEDEKSEHGGPPEETQEEEPVIEQPQGYTMSSVYPPQPCERCVRSKKTCKGIAGARCEHCKSLHQKCSNSTGPPRGRHAGKPVFITIVPGRRDSNLPNFENGASEGQGRPKRKAAAKKSKPDDIEEEDEEEDEKPNQVSKKRRVGTDTGPRRTRLLRDIAELESAIKRLQNSYMKEFAHLQRLAGSLASEIRVMDDE
ncbi:hypothetical protein L208DRAFT_1426709 [Tricholoma matsutake]|nr:hypothetical protein L208DRAFT_1426709 [Tricholoma matsutake 945]